MEYWKQELYHHGILGQKWGKRNGPPYPLSSSDHSTSERKAGWRKSLGGGNNPISRLRRRMKQTKDLRNKKKQIYEDVEKNNKEIKRLKSKQKEVQERADYIYDKNSYIIDNQSSSDNSNYRRIREKYQNLIDDIEFYEDKIDKVATKETERLFIERYGQKSLDQINKSEQFKAGVILTGALLAAASPLLISNLKGK